MYLSGSAVRGDQHKDYDIDTIAVFSKLDDEVLRRLRAVLSKYKKTSVYSLSVNDLASYPLCRYYTLNLGSKKIYGGISFTPFSSSEEIIDSIVNNIYIILQISRSYLLVENYGPRSVELINLMMKLADHGCMRLLIYYLSSTFPDIKEEVKHFFKDSVHAYSVINAVINMNELKTELKRLLLRGATELIVGKYNLLLSFAEEFQEKLKRYVL